MGGIPSEEMEKCEDKGKEDEKNLDTPKPQKSCFYFHDINFFRKLKTIGDINHQQGKSTQ